MSRKCWLLATLVVVGGLTLFAIQPCIKNVRVDTEFSYSANNIKQIGLAIRAYCEAKGRLPPASVCDADGRPLYSWRVVILPYLEQEQLYKQFHLDEPWDSPHNLQLAESMPRCYMNHKEDIPLTRYQAFVGPHTAFERSGLTFADFPDGLKNTMLVAEAEDPVPWTKPADLSYHPDQPLPKLKGPYSKPIYFLCRDVGSHPGFLACFADGSCRFIRSSTGEQTLRALITRNGGEPLGVEQVE